MADRGGSRFSGGLAHRVWAQALAAADPPRWDAADEHLATSLDLLESGDARLPAAHTRMAWARICRARGNHLPPANKSRLGPRSFGHQASWPTCGGSPKGFDDYNHPPGRLISTSGARGGDSTGRPVDSAA